MLDAAGSILDRDHMIQPYVWLPGQHGDIVRPHCELVVLAFWGGPFHGPLMDQGIRRHLEKLCGERGIDLVAAGSKYDGRHEADINLDAIRALGCHVETPTEYWLPGAMISPLVQVQAITFGNSYAPGWNRKGYPQWPSLMQLAMDAKYSARIMYHHSDRDRMLLEQMRSKIHINVHSIVDTWAQSIRYLEEFQYAIMPDSGLAHVAALYGVRTLVLFGPTLQTKNKPLGKHVRTLSMHLPCSPCQYTPNERTCRDWQCMQQMKPETVWAYFQHQRSAGW
jgi:hypothetical protein